MRERRVAECVELRKAQRVESILKRRNISSQADEEPLSPEYNTDNQQVVALLFLVQNPWCFLVEWFLSCCLLGNFSNDSGNRCQCKQRLSRATGAGLSNGQVGCLPPHTPQSLC